MKRLLIVLMVMASVAMARIDVYFGEVRCDTLQVDSLATIVSVGITSLTVDTLVVDSTASFGCVATFDDSVHVSGIVIGDGATLTFYDAAIDPYLQFTAANETAEFYGDVLADSQLTVLDTLAVGIVSPEHFFHVSDAGVYPALFEGDATGATWVAVDNNNATAECGYSIWRAGTEMWTIEDSNGTFIIYDSDDTANRLTIDGTTGNFVIYQNLSVNNDFFVTDSVGIGGDVAVAGNFVLDMVAPTYNFASASAVAGTVNDITMDFTPDLPTVGAGARVSFIAEGLNTGATTLAIDGGAAVNVFENTDVSACEGGEIVDGMAVELMHDGTQWQIISNQP